MIRELVLQYSAHVPTQPDLAAWIYPEVNAHCKSSTDASSTIQRELLKRQKNDIKDLSPEVPICSIVITSATTRYAATLSSGYAPSVSSSYHFFGTPSVKGNPQNCPTRQDDVLRPGRVLCFPFIGCSFSHCSSALKAATAGSRS